MRSINITSIYNKYHHRSSLFLPPVSPYNADLMQLKRDRKNVEYKTDVNGNLTVRNENIRIPSHLLSRDELMRNVEWARQVIKIIYIIYLDVDKLEKNF